jgi:hypothetical protein
MVHSRRRTDTIQFLNGKNKMAAIAFRKMDNLSGFQIVGTSLHHFIFKNYFMPCPVFKWSLKCFPIMGNGNAFGTNQFFYDLGGE